MFISKEDLTNLMNGLARANHEIDTLRREVRRLELLKDNQGETLDLLCYDVGRIKGLIESFGDNQGSDGKILVAGSD